MKSVTFLGPYGATFSHDAYNTLARIYGAPDAVNENCQLATHNKEILTIIRGHGGYGSIAMETLAEGRVAEPHESFIELLGVYSSNNECGFNVVGAIQIKIHLCLMTRKGVIESEIDGVVGHPKALGVCNKQIVKRKLPTISASSNGEAARLVAQNDEYAKCAALGPQSAAEKYGLHICQDAFEDDVAITTFFLIAPKSHPVSIGKTNRMLVVFRLPHTAGALAKSLMPFGEENLNIIQIHSVHTIRKAYDFAIEIEVDENQIEQVDRAMKKFKQQVESYLSFGPFEILSR